MSGFNKLSSSACAVASMILLLDRSEVVAADNINMVAVKSWPHFDGVDIGQFIGSHFRPGNHQNVLNI